ncbi:hypothetical protein Zmor_024219 [Zophobas morio]|uniref:Telomerase reverse transcriptase n=1 Tax=Zophobas morio TaxID=2755281 RepID=A0AA38M8K5_9CUCU|nr:hypothetical protein Zmor_024219 [Zophobas morio]
MYYSLSLKTKQKKPKIVNLQYNNFDLTHLNNIINITLKNLRKTKNSETNLSFKILKLLDKIIPDDYFGNKLHRRLFYRIVDNILTQSAFECIYSSTLIKGYNCECIPWLSEIKCQLTKTTLLKKANKFLLEYVVKPIVVFYYKCTKTYSGQEMRFIRIDQWDSFHTKIINTLKKSKFLEEVERSSQVQPRGYLRIIPKDNLDELRFRSIVNSFRDNPKQAYLKSLTKKIYQAARAMNKHFSYSLYDEWSSFVERVGKQKIFGTKIDVEDAYGNVNISILTNTIRSLSSEFLSDRDKDFVAEYVKSQFVIFRGKCYQWNHGLLQGDILSPSLCELYMTYYDKLFLSKFDSDCFFHRTVDDYFFCSTEGFKVANFESYMESLHKINKGKTISNVWFTCEHIPYCGKIFNLDTKEVTTLYSFSKGYEIRHKFKLWNIQRPIPESGCKNFLARAVSCSFSSNYFGKMQLNTLFNSQKTVLENFFDGMVYVAYKFDATVMALRNNFLTFCVYFNLKQCVEQYSAKVKKSISRYKGKFYKTKVKFKLLKVIGLKAFIVVLKRRNEVYKNLIAHIKKENKLKIDFPKSDVDFEYFNRLPPYLKHVKVSRKSAI